MLNRKELSFIALVLLLVGIVGSAVTYGKMEKTEWTTELVKVEDDNFQEIAISVNNGSAELLPTNESARIEVFGQQGKYKVSADTKEEKLIVHLEDKNKKLFNFNMNLKTPVIKVYVPETKYEAIQMESRNGKLKIEKIQAAELSAKTANGTVNLSEVQAETVKAHTNNGQIRAEQLTGSTIQAKSNNGRITMVDTLAEKVTLEADNGRIELQNVEGQISGTAKNGRISLLAHELNFPMELKTNNGSISIQTDREPENAIIQTRANNGSITIFGEKNGAGVYGSGEHLIHLSTQNGKIEVEKR